MAYEILPDLSPEGARKALDMAVKNGFAEEDVLTTSEGFYIPVKEEAEKPKTTRGSATKKE